MAAIDRGYAPNMPIGIALIRGINVGGKNLLPMETLRELAAEIGLRDARTYIQSGNMLFRAGVKDMARAAAKLEAAIESRLKFRPSVVVRSIEDLRAAIAANPLAKRRGIDGNRMLVMFLAGQPDAAARRNVAALKQDPEEIWLIGREAYLHLPNGIAASNLSMATVEKAIRVPGTCRNWNTVGKLLAMAEELEGEGG